MSEYVYLFRFRGVDGPASPQEFQAVGQKWMKWLQEMTDNGHLKARGQRLEPTGKLVRGKQKTVTDGPFAEAKDLVGSYMLIEAEDLDQAAELSKGCPIFESGGFVEIRPVMKM